MKLGSYIANKYGDIMEIHCGYLWIYRHYIAIIYHYITII